jgi:hypothetical protein
MTGPDRCRGAAAAAVLACAAVLAAGCASGQSPGPASSPAAAASSGLPSGAGRKALAGRYLAIAKPGNRRLEKDFDGLDDHRGNLAAAEADLRDAAATERLFDRRLLRISFPPAIEEVARRLYRINEARARLTTAAASATSLRQLQLAEPRLTAANRPVEQAVRNIRRQLGLPPPSTS